MSSNMQTHHSYNNKNRMESPRNQSLNNRLSNSNFNNSYHPPSNNQRTHSLNNPLTSQAQSQNHSQPSVHDNPNHNRRTSSLGIMDPNKRSSMSYSNSPVSKYSPDKVIVIV